MNISYVGSGNETFFTSIFLVSANFFAHSGMSSDLSFIFLASLDFSSAGTSMAKFEFLSLTLPCVVDFCASIECDSEAVGN